MVLIYNLADTFFIGQTHDDLQVAAVSLATPVFPAVHVRGNGVWYRRHLGDLPCLGRRTEGLREKGLLVLYSMC